MIQEWGYIRILEKSQSIPCQDENSASYINFKEWRNAYAYYALLLLSNVYVFYILAMHFGQKIDIF